jgi:hypothetical protein
MLEEGWAGVQRLSWSPWSWFELEAGVTLFDGPSMYARPSVIEPSIPGSLDLPVLVGRGMREYLLFEIHPSRDLFVTVKHAVSSSIFDAPLRGDDSGWFSNVRRTALAVQFGL